MAAITEISLSNFRGFARVERLRLAPLTFLVGPNSSGKSSLADAILFMAQSGFLSLEATNPIWAGPLVDLGSFQDTVYRHEPGRVVEVLLRVSGLKLLRGARRLHDELTVDVRAQVRTAKVAPDGRLARLGIADVEKGVSGEIVRRPGRHESFLATADSLEKPYVPQAWQRPAGMLSTLLTPSDRRRSTPHLASLLEQPVLRQFAGSIQRVSSGRDRPRRFYERNGSSAGERARRLLDGIDSTGLEAGQAHLRRSLVAGLLALDIADELDASRLGDYHSAIKLQDNRTGVLSNLADFGYGASQVIPVLEGCASPGPGPLFVEQPEIHLHPRAQGHLAQILCKASGKRQIIVETHSEHMVNRARRLIAEGEMSAEDVIIQYIDRGPDGSHAIAIGLDEAGDFTRDWPDGFYDERYVETMKIAEAQAKRAAG